MCARLDTTGLLADVMYAVLRGNVDAGRERCRLYRRADGGYWLTSEFDLTLPSPHTLYSEVCVGADWRVESLKVRWSGNELRDASHHVDGLLWKATIQTDEATIERAVPFEPGTQVDFESVWSAMLALNWLKLTPGQAREVKVIRVELPSLEPVPAHRHYECIGQEHVTTLAGDFEAMHYIPNAHHLWADSRGIIVAADGYRLLEYHWLS